MIIRNHDDNERPNYLLETLAGVVIAICIGINLFGDQLGYTSLDAKPADGFGGFKMVNVKHHHIQASELADNN